MHNLLTGQNSGNVDPDKPMTKDEHLVSMQRLLHLANNQSLPFAEIYLKAADVHARAAQVLAEIESGKSALPVTADDVLKTMPPARTTPRDGDTV